MTRILRRGIFPVALAILVSSEGFSGGDPWTSSYPGDAAFQRMEYDSAVRSYDSVASVQPRDAGALWRLARVEVCIADTIQGSGQESYYRTAADNARKCIAIDSTISEGHSWLAAALGNLAMYEGSRKKVELCQTIKTELDRALQLDPDNDLAYSILGSFYRALGNISWLERTLANILYGSIPSGGYAEGEIALKKAIALAPNVIRHHFELGMLYTDWGKQDEAKSEFEIAARCPLLTIRDRATLEKAKAFAEKQ